MNILLVRLRLIGDVVFTTPVIRAMKRRFPHSRLSYLVEPHAAPVVARNPHLDRVIVARRLGGVDRVREDLRTARLLRASRFDLAVDLHGGPRSAWLTLASGAATRIGYAIPGRRWMYTHTVARPRRLRPRHSVENQWDLLASLGEEFGTSPDPRRDSVEMVEDPDAVDRVTRRVLGGIEDDQALVVLHVSAGNPFRRWPAHAFVELLVRLVSADPRRRVVLTAGPSDAETRLRVTAESRQRLGTLGHAILDCGEFDLAELQALVGRAALFIGGDSGPLHIASTTKTPIVGIYGPTLPVRSAPWRDPDLITESVEPATLPCRPCNQRRCEPGDFRCLTALGPERVADAAERALGRRVYQQAVHDRSEQP